MFVYIDESGHPHPDDHERPVVVAMCLHPEEVRHITGAIYNFTQEFDRATPNLRLRAAEREGKATEFLARSQFPRIDAKREFAERVVGLIRDVDLTVFAMVMERPDRPVYRGDDHLQQYHQWLLERVNYWMQERFPNRRAILVFDGRDQQENIRLDACFTRFLFRHPTGRAMDRIVPNVLFVDSELTPGIKLADFCAYILRVYYEEGLEDGPPEGDSYLDAMAQFGEVVRAKTFNYVDDEYGVQHGIRTMGKEHYRYEDEEEG